MVGEGLRDYEAVPGDPVRVVWRSIPVLAFDGACLGTHSDSDAGLGGVMG